MDNYTFLKLLSVPGLNAETCGSKFPALFTPFPLKYINAISLSPLLLDACQEEAEAAAIAQTATVTVLKTKQ